MEQTPAIPWLLVVTLGAIGLAVSLAVGVIRYRAWRASRAQRHLKPTD